MKNDDLDLYETNDSNDPAVKKTMEMLEMIAESGARKAGEDLPKLKTEIEHYLFSDELGLIFALARDEEWTILAPIRIDDNNLEKQNPNAARAVRELKKKSTYKQGAAIKDMLNTLEGRREKCNSLIALVKEYESNIQALPFEKYREGITGEYQLYGSNTTTILSTVKVYREYIERQAEILSEYYQGLTDQEKVTAVAEKDNRAMLFLQANCPAFYSGLHGMLKSGILEKEGQKIRLKEITQAAFLYTLQKCGFCDYSKLSDYFLQRSGEPIKNAHQAFQSIVDVPRDYHKIQYYIKK